MAASLSDFLMLEAFTLFKNIIMKETLNTFCREKYDDVGHWAKISLFKISNVIIRYNII